MKNLTVMSDYIAPSAEIIGVEVEQGFAGSTVDSTGSIPGFQDSGNGNDDDW